SAKPYADSFVVNMRDAGVNVRNIRDFVFLSGYLEPTLALLHEQAPTWVGQVENACDTCVVTVVSLDMSRKTVSVINSAEKLPYDCQVLLTIPEPVGGVLVLASSSVSHVVNGTLSCISVLNRAATHGIGAAMGSYLDMTNADLGLTLNPLASVAVVVGGNTHGRVFLLKLAGNGRLVKRIVAKRIVGTDVRSKLQEPVAHTWDDIAVIPSCATELHLSQDDDGDGAPDECVLFVGGNSGRSLLLGFVDLGAPSGARSGAAPAPLASNSRDVDAGLYGDVAMPDLATAGATAAATVASPAASPDGGDDDSWATRYRVTVHDELVGTGMVAAMDIGVPAAVNALGYHGTDALELVTCLGNDSGTFNRR
ncbi:mRNA cleavage and polyadenylation factor subunit, partial [Coemansia nantahalensis]